MRVLIAEDDPATAKFLKITLQKAGYDVVVTYDGRAAWQALQGDDAPKLAILDWMMPIMSGYEVCRNLRETHEDIRTYVIFLTAKRGEGDICAALDAGADDYIAKPFNKREFLSRLKAGERMVALQQQLQHRIDEVESLIRQHGLFCDKLHNQAGPSDSDMATRLKIDEAFAKTLNDLGISSTHKKAQSDLKTRAKPEFAAWSALFLKRNSMWLDIKMEVDRVTAWAMCADATGNPPDTNERLLDILAGTLNMTQINFKRAFQEREDEVITPFISKAMPVQNLPAVASPVKRSSLHVFSGPDIAIRLTVDRHRAPIKEKTLYELCSLDVLADPVHITNNNGGVRLNSGIALNAHHLPKLRDLAKFRPDFLVSVIEPSPVTKAFLSL